jgi:hypothetical protein
VYEYHRHSHAHNEYSRGNKKIAFTYLSARALLMNKVPFSVRFKFNLAQYRSGQFSVDVTMDTVNKDIVNPFAEPLGRFTI